jgi:hypothetical protein
MAANSDRVTRFTSKPDPQMPNVLRIPEHIRTTHGDDGAIVLDILHGQIFRLNPVGSRIFALLEQRAAEQEIVEKVVGEFRIDAAAAEADVGEFVTTLEQHHLIVFSPASE